MPNIRKITFTPKHQPDSAIAQAAPVQNTWYTVLAETKNARIYTINYVVADTNETIETRLTIDGNTLVNSRAATAGTIYYITLNPFANTSSGPISSTSTDPTPSRAFLVEGQSVKVEIRKTTAAGAGTLSCCVVHAKW